MRPINRLTFFHEVLACSAFTILVKKEFDKATAVYTLVKQQREKRLRQIKCDIAKIDAAMQKLAHLDQRMNKRLDILSSIPGIGMTTALMILMDMPKIAH